MGVLLLEVICDCLLVLTTPVLLEMEIDSELPLDHFSAPTTPFTAKGVGGGCQSWDTDLLIRSTIPSFSSPLEMIKSILISQVTQGWPVLEAGGMDNGGIPH